ncbi:FadR family transcriptional regulator [Pseudomonas cannabina]|nr:FadR family transcriptional regulator [Pseudomonas cannabina]
MSVSLVEGVVSTIRKEIASGGLPADSKMPTEHELADQLGVSRSVVREAISQLKADGVLVVAACNRNGPDLQSSRFSTRIDCIYPSQQTGIICE